MKKDLRCVNLFRIFLTLCLYIRLASGHPKVTINCLTDYFEIKINFDQDFPTNGRIFSKGERSLCFFPTQILDGRYLKEHGLNPKRYTNFRLPLKHCGTIKANATTFRNAIFIETPGKGNRSYPFQCSYRENILIPEVSNINKIQVLSSNSARLNATCLKERIRVDLIFEKSFNGSLYTAGGNSSIKANRCLFFGNGSRHLTFSLKYDECGTTLGSDNDYTNRIIIELPNEYQGRPGFEIHVFRCKIKHGQNLSTPIPATRRDTSPMMIMISSSTISSVMNNASSPPIDSTVALTSPPTVLTETTSRPILLIYGTTPTLTEAQTTIMVTTVVTRVNKPRYIHRNTGSGKPWYRKFSSNYNVIVPSFGRIFHHNNIHHVTHSSGGPSLQKGINPFKSSPFYPVFKRRTGSWTKKSSEIKSVLGQVMTFKNMAKVETVKCLSKMMQINLVFAAEFQGAIHTKEVVGREINIVNHISLGSSPTLLTGSPTMADDEDSYCNLLNSAVYDPNNKKRWIVMLPFLGCGMRKLEVNGIKGHENEIYIEYKKNGDTYQTEVFTVKCQD